MRILANGFRLKSLSGQVLFIVLVALAVACADHLHAQDGDTLKKRFLEDAPHKWREYGQFLAALQGTVKAKNTRGGKVVYAATSIIKQNADSKLVEREYSAFTDSPKGSPTGIVAAANPAYSFSLRRGKENQWVLKEIEVYNSEKKTGPLADEANDAMRLLHSLTKIGPTHLAELVEQPTFRVLNAKKIDNLGREAVQIEFDNTHELGGKNTFIPVQSGTLILDPNRYWCLRKYEVKVKFSNAEGKDSGESTYRDSKSNYPIPLRLREKYERIDSGNEKRGYIEHDFELEEPARLPDYDEFTLSAFGLSEPASVRRPGSRWYLWFIAGAVLSLGIGWYFFRRLRKPTVLPVARSVS